MKYTKIQQLQLIFSKELLKPLSRVSILGVQEAMFHGCLEIGFVKYLFSIFQKSILLNVALFSLRESLGPNLVPKRSLQGPQGPPKIAASGALGDTQGALKWYQDGSSSLEPSRSCP